MKISTKSRILQVSIITIFLGVQGLLFLIFSSTIGIIEGGLILIGILSLYASILGLFFAAIDKEKSYLGFFILHILAIGVGVFFANTPTQWILLAGMMIVYVGVLQLTFSAVSKDISERLVLTPKRSILPHLKSIGFWVVGWITLLTYIWTVTNTAPNFLLQESDISLQVEPFEKLVQNIIPSYSTDLTVESILKEQVQKQLEDSPVPVDTNTLIQEQIEKINEQYQLSVQPTTTINGAIVEFINNRFLSQITPQIFAVSMASLVGLTSFSFIWIYMLCTRIILKVFYEIARRKEIIKIETVLVNQEQISL